MRRKSRTEKKCSPSTNPTPFVNFKLAVNERRPFPSCDPRRIDSVCAHCRHQCNQFCRSIRQASMILETNSAHWNFKYLLLTPWKSRGELYAKRVRSQASFCGIRILFWDLKKWQNIRKSRKIIDGGFKQSVDDGRR